MAHTAAALLRKRYRLRELIGRGGTASVYRAHDEALGRDVAIKMYPPTTDARDAKRQEDEVTVLASLSHHGLVTLLDAGMERTAGSTRVYIVMELVAGMDLQHTISAGRPGSRDVAHIGYDLAEALQYVHHKGVVHRDIKPSNVLMVDYQDAGNRARAKLTDFGIARSSASRVAEEGVTTGTAAYLSPEQVRRAAVGPPSDIYSLGLVLLECFTGELAFPGEPVASALARLGENPRVPETITDEWRNTLMAMTAAVPADRPTAAQLVELMRHLVAVETGRGDTRARVGSEPAFDRTARLAARALDVPMAIVRVVDGDRIWVTPWLTENTKLDPRALTDEAAAKTLGLRFYASVPLRNREGLSRGSISVMDFDDRDLSREDALMLEDLATLIVGELDRWRDRRSEHSSIRDTTRVNEPA